MMLIDELAPDAPFAPLRRRARAGVRVGTMRPLGRSRPGTHREIFIRIRQDVLWLLLHLRRGACKPLPPRVRPRPQWCRRTVMMPRGRSGGHEDAAVGRGVAIIRKHEPSVTRRRHHRWPA